MILFTNLLGPVEAFLAFFFPVTEIEFNKIRPLAIEIDV